MKECNLFNNLLWSRGNKISLFSADQTDNSSVWSIFYLVCEHSNASQREFFILYVSILMHLNVSFLSCMWAF